MGLAALGQVAKRAAPGPTLAFHKLSGERAMHAPAMSQRWPFRTGCDAIEALPDPLPKPPGRPPGEPIIIKDPPRPPEAPEIDGSLDDEDEPEIEKHPEIIPEKRPPPAPWERAVRCREGASAPARRAGTS
jgi:hypothetical protein